MNFFKTMKSPLGEITLVSNETHLLALYVGDENKPLTEEAQKKDKHPVLTEAQKQLKEYFDGKRISFDIPLAPQGTDFQNKAWKALCKIPFGQVWSYGQQAKFLRFPTAQRAVGGANGRNPIPVIIPCHRVVGSSGKLTGFSGGMEMKIFLLKHEGHQIDSDGLKLITV